MITLDEAGFTFEGSEQPALADVSVEIAAGELVLVCGRSGCGKSTLLKLLNGVAPGFEEGEVAGSIRVADIDPGQVTMQELSATVGSVFQHPRSQLFSIDTVDELLFGCGNHRVDREVMLGRLDETVAAFGIEEFLDRSTFRLSGGEAQKIVCASTHMNRPSVYVLDEPSANLDDGAIDQLVEVLVALKRSGATIVVAEHRLHYLADLCDRVLYLDEGRLVAQYTGDEFRALDDDRRSTMGLRATAVEQLSADGDGDGAGDGDDVGDGDGAGEGRAASGESAPDPTADAVTVERLRCRRRRRTIVDVAGLELPKHSVIALTGPNGVGKSTFLAGLSGAMKADAVVDDGGKLSRRQRLRRSFVVMQDVHQQLFGESVLDEVLLGHDLDDEARLAQADDVLTSLGLASRRDVHPYCLFGGEKQRTAVAAALLANTRYLLFDEPTSGIDLDHMTRFGRLLQEIKGSVDLVIVATHDREFVRSCADHVVELSAGRASAPYRLR
ncbi:MAG: ABC transporter ATP-binding protein [Actinomycetota bacterium]